MRSLAQDSSKRVIRHFPLNAMFSSLNIPSLNAFTHSDPCEPLSNAGEFGAVVEELSELATVYVFSHSSSEFARPRTCRVTQGTRRRGLPGRPFLPLASFGRAKEG